MPFTTQQYNGPDGVISGGFSEPWAQFTVRIGGVNYTFNSYYEYEDYVRFAYGVNLGLGADSPGLPGGPAGSSGLTQDTPRIDTNRNLGGTEAWPPGPAIKYSQNRVDVKVREQVLMTIGELKTESTGKLKFALIEGWTNSNAAKSDNNVYAHTPNDPLYTAALRCSQIQGLSLPANAIITGIKVYVRRKRV